MSKTCSVENMDVDGEVVGSVFTTDDGKHMATSWREIHVNNVFCSDCGSDLPCNSSTIDEVIKAHLEEA